MKKTQKMMKLDVMEHCAWNPRSQEELSPEHPEMVKLIASVRELGIVQPIAVWAGKVIAGNRRYEAAKIVGLDSLPAVEFEGITEAQAREITRVENEVRLGVNPIRDAALIESMLNLGYDQKEIAAHFGVSEATVCRRAKLTALAPEIREIAIKGSIATDCLERISCYSPDVQKRMAKVVGSAVEHADGTMLHWKTIQWDFGRETKNLSQVIFDTSDCAHCPKRTGAQVDLWGGSDDGLGKCLDCDCFLRKQKEAALASVRAKAGDAAMIDGEEQGLSGWDCQKNTVFFSSKRTAKQKFAWWFFDEYNGKVEVFFGGSVDEWQSFKRTEEEKRKALCEAESKENARRSQIVATMHEKREAIFKWQSEIDAEEMHYQVKQLLPAKLRGSAIVDLLGSALIALTDWNVDDAEMLCELFKEFPKFATSMGVAAADVEAYQAAKKEYEENKS